jgi:DNA primase
MKLIDVPSLLDRLGIKTKRRGRELWACCPLHDEKTPSWQMRDDPEDQVKHGRWRCLGKCHTGGGPISLVMHVLGLQPKEAWEWIKTGSVHERIALAIHFEDNAPDLSRFVFGFHLPQGVEFAPLFDWPMPASNYLHGKRGVTAEQVDRWGIGFARDGKLAKRIVFPWREASGKLLGYTARAYTPNEKRYLEPGEKEGAARGAVYGEEQWPPPGAARDTIVVVEGAIDGLAVERATGLPFGAACGSQFLPAHAAKISTFRRVIVASDPDAAGASFQAVIHGSLARWSTVIPIDLPIDAKGGRYDPARLAFEKGNDELRRIIEGANA